MYVVMNIWWAPYILNKVEIGYHQTCNIKHTLVGNHIIDHSDVLEYRLSRCPNNIFIFDLTPGFNGMGNDNCRTRENHLSFGIWCYLY